MHDKDDSPQARINQFDQGDPHLTMPECDELIVQAFIDCGIYTSNGMGVSALTWQEIQAYSEISGVNLTHWEARMVHLMSKEYVAFKNFATENRHARSPYKPAIDDNAISGEKQLMGVLG